MRKTSVPFGMLFGIAVCAASLQLALSQKVPRTHTKELLFHRNWAERAFGEAGTSEMSDSRLVVLHEDVAGDTKKNLSSAGSELKVGEEIFDKGLGVSPNTTLRVELTKPAVAFKAEIGVDQFCDSIPSSVRFRVEAGGKDLFVSDPIRASQGRRLIDIPLGGIQAFNLTVEAAPGSRGGGRSDWINGRVLFQ